MDPLQIVWARYFGAFLLALIFLNPDHQAKIDDDDAARSCSSAVRPCCFYPPG